ncbi:hypothetical protein SAMN05444280_11276 [Tangfeifania diversioriginum]|uniref:Uncharacterized protein n=1 Tax=Tangfeifania diversioriginum TaxID=1168035 RepID=A0A1M6H498_9BACT|nr:hypothetical protein [Tangfeifania diversioriginum]SHJ16952.1 hypothetical protein SAMN05444280_11276 [Tangfeifania diversioriginum]
MMKIRDLPKEAKLQILKKINSGEMKVKEGIFLENGAENGMIVITHNEKYYSDNSLKHELSQEFINSYPGGIVFMPCNNRK